LVFLARPGGHRFSAEGLLPRLIRLRRDQREREEEKETTKRVVR